MNETNAALLRRDILPVLQRTSLQPKDSAVIQEASLQTLEATASTKAPNGQESYELGTTLKNVGLFRQTAEHFERSAQDPALAVKGFAQMGFSLKQSGRLEEAAVAFRRALQVSSPSSKEQVQILYLLGRTLESLERIPEALEAYRWFRRKAPQYRDVAMRIESLSKGCMHRDNDEWQGQTPQVTQALESWQGLLRRKLKSTRLSRGQMS